MNTKHHSADVVRTILLRAIVGAGGQVWRTEGLWFVDERVPVS